MKAFVTAFYCETNSFSPLPCGWQSFKEQMLYRPGEHPDMLHEVTAPLYALRRRARERGWEVVEGTCAYAKPSAPVQRGVYEAIRDEILGQLRAALPLDMVVLSLHGAMLADGYLDCEADMAARVREIVGPDAAVGMLLDPHCHLSRGKLDNCDAVILLKEAPHTDFAERSEELLHLLARRVAGAVTPHHALFDCHMVDLLVTTQEPMRSFVDQLHALEKRPGVLTISVAHGMELGDSPDMGARVLVTTNGQPRLGEALAHEIGMKLFDLRGKCRPQWVTLAAALDRAAKVEEGPVVFADSSDNPGAGAAGDSTFLLRGLLDRGIESVAIGPIWDPVAVRIAFEAGLGARLPMRIGGKMGPESGDPIDVMAEVIGLKENAEQTWAGTKLAVGNAAAIRFNGVEAVLNDKRTQLFGADLFTGLNIDPRGKKIVVAKSTMAFMASFQSFLKGVVFVAAPGSGNHDLSARRYRHIKRPIWPLDTDPFAASG
mgnify:CR=1 FL=1